MLASEIELMIYLILFRAPTDDLLMQKIEAFFEEYLTSSDSESADDSELNTSSETLPGNQRLFLFLGSHRFWYRSIRVVEKFFRTSFSAKSDHEFSFCKFTPNSKSSQIHMKKN